MVSVQLEKAFFTADITLVAGNAQVLLITLMAADLHLDAPVAGPRYYACWLLTGTLQWNATTVYIISYTL